MNKVTRPLAFFMIAVLALLAGYLAHIWLLDTDSAEDPAQVLLAEELHELNGAKRMLTHWQGNVLVVNFWATWCPPCLKEIPEFMRLQDRLGHRGVQFVGIAIDDKDKVAAYVASQGVNYPILMPTDGLTLARRSGNRLGGLPFTVIIDRKGRTAKVELGVLDEHKLLGLVEGLL